MQAASRQEASGRAIARLRIVARLRVPPAAIARWLATILLVALPAALSAQDLTSQTAHLEDLRSIREIKFLQARWGHLALAGDWAAMADLASDDAVLATRYGEIDGKGGIAAWLKTTQGQGIDGMPAGRFNLHVFISPVITLAADGQSAIGRWHEIAMTAQKGGEAGWRGTTDVIDYRRTPAGWRIARIRPYVNFTGPYATGWMHDAKTLERAPYHYTPDEAGMLLPARRAAAPLPAVDVASQATLLLRQSEALNMVDAYGFYLDRGLYDDVADLFAQDATIEVAGQGSWTGRAGVAAFLSRFGKPGLKEGELDDRAQLMPLATISADGSSALVRTVELGMTGQHGGTGYWSAALMSYLLRLDDDGKWRIALLHRSPIMRSEYKAGWSDPLPAALPPSEGGAPSGTTRLPSVDFAEHPYTIAALGPAMITPPRGPAAPLTPVPDALAKAEAFDGAENVADAYGYYIDQFAWRDTADLFSRDGWKELSYIGTFIGKDHVMRSMIQRYGEGGPNDAFQAIHQKTQPYVTVLDGGQRALVRLRLLQFNSSSTGSGSWIAGIYEDQVEKEDGIWRIHGMDLDYLWLADYATGWTGIDPEASARFVPKPEVIAAFHPDAPLRGEVVAPYPRIAPLGFHFVNPSAAAGPRCCCPGPTAIATRRGSERKGGRRGRPGSADRLPRPCVRPRHAGQRRCLDRSRLRLHARRLTGRHGCARHRLRRALGLSISGTYNDYVIRALRRHQPPARHRHRRAGDRSLHARADAGGRDRRHPPAAGAAGTIARIGRRAVAHVAAAGTRSRLACSAGSRGLPAAAPARAAAGGGCRHGDRPFRPPGPCRSAWLPWLRRDAAGGRRRPLLDQAFGRLPPGRPCRLGGRSRWRPRMHRRARRPCAPQAGRDGPAAVGQRRAVRRLRATRELRCRARQLPRMGARCRCARADLSHRAALLFLLTLIFVLTLRRPDSTA